MPDWIPGLKDAGEERRKELGWNRLSERQKQRVHQRVWLATLLLLAAGAIVALMLRALGV